MEDTTPLLIRALNREPTPRTPVWIMRQAGRHLPEYLKLRERQPEFVRFIRDPKLTTEAALQPLRRYQLDASIVFSDILVIPEALGMKLHFDPHRGPVFESAITTNTEIAKLPWEMVGENTAFVPDAISHLSNALAKEFPHMPLIGFCGAPWTLLTYMFDWQHDRNLEARAWLQSQQKQSQELLQRLTQSCTDLLLAQINAGAQCVQIFDTWAGVLQPLSFKRAVLEPLKQIVTQVKRQFPQVPVILFCKDCNDHLDSLADLGCDAVGVDWTLDLSQARLKTDNRVALQGNMDPSILTTDVDTVRNAVRKVLDSYGNGYDNGYGHVFNLGHGITPQAKPELVKAMIQEVREYSGEEID